MPSRTKAKQKTFGRVHAVTVLGLAAIVAGYMAVTSTQSNAQTLPPGTGTCSSNPLEVCTADTDCTTPGDICNPAIVIGTCALVPSEPCITDADCDTAGDVCEFADVGGHTIDLTGLQITCTEPVPPPPTVEYWMSVYGVQGDALQSDHLGEIVVSGFDWGSEELEPPGVSPGTQDDVSTIKVTAVVDRSAPLLVQYCNSGSIISDGDPLTPDVVLSARELGYSFDFAKIELNDVYCTSYKTVGELAPNRYSHEYTLSFGSYNYQFIPTTTTGAPGTPESYGWTLLQGTIPATPPPDEDVPPFF